MFIISILLFFQAKTQAALWHHNIRRIALNNDTVIALIFSGILSILAHSANYSYGAGDYVLDAGFILKEDKLKEYPAFYSRSFSLRE